VISLFSALFLGLLVARLVVRLIERACTMNDLLQSLRNCHMTVTLSLRCKV